MRQTAVSFLENIAEISKINFFLHDLYKNLNEKLDSLILYVDNEITIESDSINLESKWIQQTRPIIRYYEHSTTHRATWEILEKTLIKHVQTERDSVIHINSMCKSHVLHSMLILSYYLGFIPKPSTIWTGLESTEGIRFFPISLPIKISFTSYASDHVETNFKALYNKNVLESPNLIEALDIINACCQIPESNLLILGEKGTGKSRIVEEQIGHIKNKIVTTIVCGSLNRELAMSQLFGYEKGAYTGALKSQAGLVQEAENGILFFDEVQDLPKEVQRMLVRFLQDKEHRYRPVGSTKEFCSNTELIFASHLSLEALRETIDDDLLDRISLVTVEIPPLRSIRADIPTIWKSVWKEHNVIHEFPDAPDNDLLQDYFSTDMLEGNLRTLVALCKMINIFYIQTKDIEKSCELAIYSQKNKKYSNSKDSVGSSCNTHYVIDFSKDLKTMTQDFKRTIITRLYQQAYTNQQIAKILQIDEKTVRNILSGNFS